MTRSKSPKNQSTEVKPSSLTIMMMKMPLRVKKMQMMPIMTKMKMNSKTTISKMPTKPNSMREKVIKSFDEEKFNCSASGPNTC